MGGSQSHEREGPPRRSVVMGEFRSSGSQAVWAWSPTHFAPCSAPVRHSWGLPRAALALDGIPEGCLILLDSVSPPVTRVILPDRTPPPRGLGGRQGVTAELRTHVHGVSTHTEASLQLAPCVILALGTQTHQPLKRKGFSPAAETQDGEELGLISPHCLQGPSACPEAEGSFRWHSQRDQPFGAILSPLLASGAGAGRPSGTACGHPHRPALSTCRQVCQPPAQAKLTSGGFLPSWCPGLREQGLSLVPSLLEGPGHLPVAWPAHRTGG